VDAVVGVAALMTRAFTIKGASLAEARAVAMHATDTAIAMAKRQFEMAATTSFDTFLEAEFAMPPLMQQTEDHKEGVAAFRERRPAAFSGS